MKLWVITTNMGYGHQRASYPLRHLANQRILTANNDEMISEEEKRVWRRLQNSYELISRFSSLPIFGKTLFQLYDFFQTIKPLYPFRDLSIPNFGVKYMKRLIRKNLCKSLITHITQYPEQLPIVTTFYLPALAADYSGYKKIYCVITDCDINRVWVSDKPKNSAITYFVPTERAQKRLQSYGVTKNRIILTGFPLPKELIGQHNEVMRENLANRLVNLDPEKRYEAMIKSQKGIYFTGKKTHILTLTFMIGGAGAQQDILYTISASLAKAIREKQVRLQVLFGTHLDRAQKYTEYLSEIGIHGEEYVLVQASPTIEEYFSQFVALLHNTDILLTKPSEMSFYAALGIPILILPPLGAHEEYNLQWLVQNGSGLKIDNPQTIDEWLFDWIDQGLLAKAAMDGYLFSEHRGTYHIEEYLQSKYK